MYRNQNSLFQALHWSVFGVLFLVLNDFANFWLLTKLLLLANCAFLRRLGLETYRGLALVSSRELVVSVSRMNVSVSGLNVTTAAFCQNITFKTVPFLCMYNYV